MSIARISAPAEAPRRPRRPSPRALPAPVAGVLALQRSAGNQAVARLLQRTPADTAPAPRTLNHWPFAASPDVVAAYLDEHVTEVAVNAVLGRVYLVLDSGEQVSFPIAAIDDTSLELVPFFPPEASLEAAAAAVPAEWRADFEGQGMTVCVFYTGDGGVVWPSVLNAQTLPRLLPAYRLALEAAGEDAERTAETLADIALWYIGVRVAGMRSKRPANGGPAAPTPTPAPFNAGALADELLGATSSVRGNGPKLIEAAKRLSSLDGLNAQQKVDAMLEFMRRINFAIHQQGVVTESGALVMRAPEGGYAFRFAIDTAKITYGRFDMMAGTWTWTAL